jgi:hypothetical protein
VLGHLLDDQLEFLWVLKLVHELEMLLAHLLEHVSVFLLEVMLVTWLWEDELVTYF